MKLNKYICMLGLATMALTTACDDQSDLATEIDYSRLFAPINLEAKVTNQVNVRLNWSTVSGATSYVVEFYEDNDQVTDSEDNDSEVLDFSGTPVKSLSDVTAEQLPIVVKGFESETKYLVRVMAKGEKADSKWSGARFKTSAEQIMQEVNPDELTATSVVLRWTPGEEAEKIVITPGDIEHKVTSAEIAEGAATIEGLTPETQYTAKLMKSNGKSRGSVTFETLIDLGDAIGVYPEDDWTTLFTEAEDGTIFALFPGTYSMPVDSESGKIGKLALNKSISIKAVRPNDRPVINGSFQLMEGASLISLKQVILDGTGTDGSQAFDYKEAGTYAGIEIDDCEIHHYGKGFFYINVAAQLDHITINNSLIHDIECDGGDMFDCRAGAYNSFSLTNSTVWNSCLARDFVRMDDKSSNFAGVAPVITISNNTLVGVSNDASRRIFYVRFKGNVLTFTNNIVTATVGNFSNQKNTAVPTFGKNVYFQAEGLTTAGANANALWVDDKATVADPQFKDAANGDFTVGNEDVTAGDPRWLN